MQGNINYNSSHTVAPGINDATDVIRNGRVQLDANASYRVTKRLTVYAEATSLLNAPPTDYLAARERLYTNQFYGYTGRGGIKYRF